MITKSIGLLPHEMQMNVRVLPRGRRIPQDATGVAGKAACGRSGCARVWLLGSGRRNWVLTEAVISPTDMLKFPGLCAPTKKCPFYYMVIGKIKEKPAGLYGSYPWLPNTVSSGICL